MGGVELSWAGVWFNFLWQSFAVALAGALVLRLIRHRAATERALVSMCCLTVLMVLPLAGVVAPYFPGREYLHPATVVAPQASTPAKILPEAQKDVAVQPVAPPTATRAESLRTLVARLSGPLMAVWGAGALLMLFRLFYGLAFLRGFRFGLKPVDDAKVDTALALASEVLRLRNLPRVYTSPVADSPLTVGLIDPVMIFPEKLLGELSENETSSIVLHELSHVWRRDHLTGLFKRLVVAVNWWNWPVYRICTEHSDAAEELSDNCALLKLKPEDYSECLLQLAEKTGLISRLPAVIGMAARSGGLRQRVLNILSKQRKIEMQTTQTKKLIGAATIALTLLIMGESHIAFAQNTPAVKDGNNPTYWEKFKAWDAMRKLGDSYAKKDEVAKLQQELSQGIWLVKFKPVNGFNPRNATQMIKEFQQCSNARSTQTGIGGASVFRTTVTGDFLTASFLTETPEKLKEDLGKSKKLQFISMEKVTPETLAKYVDTKQEFLGTQPTVVETFPGNGATVDASSVKEIRVTFNVDMNSSGWSFCTDGKMEFPKVNGSPYWKDNRTCVMPGVKLEPGKEYSIWFNLGSNSSFADQDGISSLPYHLTFKTAAAK